MNFLTGLLIGLIAGAILGIGAMCLVVAGKDDEE